MKKREAVADAIVAANSYFMAMTVYRTKKDGYGFTNSVFAQDNQRRELIATYLPADYFIGRWAY